MAGIIAGNGNNRPDSDPLHGNYIGVAPDANLVSIKIADDEGDATVLDVIYGLQFAVDFKDDYNIRVVNLSLESTEAQSYKTDPLAAAAEAAWFNGIVVVAAAGNRGSDSDAVKYAPGNDPYVISVGAVDDQGTKSTGDDALASWSSRGSHPGRLLQARGRRTGRAHRLQPGTGQRVRRHVFLLRRLRRVHPRRRHLDVRADGRGRRGQHAPAAPRADSRPGQGRADGRRPRGCRRRQR